MTEPDDSTQGRGPSPLRRWVVLGLAGVILVVGGGLIGGLVALRLGPSGGCSVDRIAADVLPTVVTLSITNGAQASNGSGQIIDDNGHILTNDHVISPAGRSGTIEVILGNGRHLPATVVGRAPELDLAVVQIEADPELSKIRIGESTSLRVGQSVVALGAPLGLSNTVTSGIVSALGRDIPVPTDSGQTARLPGAVQTDASINPGNSGGALVDCRGRLVGVNTAIATVPNASGEGGGGNVGIGFAIPVDLAMLVAGQLIDEGRFVPVYFGAETTPISPAAAAQLNRDGGLVVQAVTRDGPAQTAGLRPGDVITAVADQPTVAPDSIWLVTLDRAVGDTVAVEYIRDGQEETADVKLGSRP